MTIAGIGAITAYGWGRERLWDGLLSGKSAAALQSGYGPGRDEDAWVSLVDACRPFQEGSRGFSMGEASVAFVLTRRAERPYAAVLGGAMSNDAYHVVSVDPTHEQILDCVRRALADAGVAAVDVSYFNAHGTGTRQCDVAEHHLLERLFADRPHIYALKPLAGHCEGAAAAVEVAAAALGYDRGIVPAAPIVAPAHPRLLDGPAAFEGGITAKLSLGMGGNNSVVVLGVA
ncbi:hypothetical protein [Nocardia gipuzkoensis]|uniref:hypothetical protein n=1 Tax=Nocardia gipuzkoensis TaxID=2749991 RepID=UPI0015EEFDF5|nr:hypothetical protein [Nocardia gipuzkoensis]